MAEHSVLPRGPDNDCNTIIMNNWSVCSKYRQIVEEKGQYQLQTLFCWFSLAFSVDGEVAKFVCIRTSVSQGMSTYFAL